MTIWRETALNVRCLDTGGVERIERMDRADNNGEEEIDDDR